MRRFLQLALDLFDATPAAAPVASAPAPAPDVQAPFQPAPTLSSVLAPAQFSHPRANRQARLCEAVVAYEFKRGRRRTIGMVVGPDGLVVSAPRWVPLYEVEAALQEKASWIVRKLDESRQRQQRLASARIVWADGVCFPYLGETVQLVLDPGHAHPARGASLTSAAATVELRTPAQSPRPAGAGTDPQETPSVRHQLQVSLPHSATPEQIRDAVQAWLMRQAQQVFSERLDHFAPRLQVQWRKLSLSSAGTRWGSARSDGAIRLNWRLIHFERAVIDYVVAHELSHLRVMDHSPRFWDTVRSVVPDYAQLRSQLRDEALPRWH